MRKRYIQHPITHKLIPAEEYVRPDMSRHAIHGDIEPFKSYLDGSVIGSRRALREHNTRHGVVTQAELGNEQEAAIKRREDFYAGRPYDTERRRDALLFAAEVHEHRGSRTEADLKQMTENYRRAHD